MFVAIFAITKFNSKSIEGLGMLPSFKPRPMKVGMSSAGPSKGSFYSIPGTYQSALNPRMNGGVDFGANIRYNPPSYKNMGVPSNPIQGGCTVGNNNNINKNSVEKYGCFAPTCGKGGSEPGCGVNRAAPIMNSDYANGNYNDQVDKLMQSEFASESTVVDQVPVGQMETLNALGETVQPIVFDRMIYANRNSRLRSQGDMIRGDLAITPCNTGWFQVSVDPSIDLQQGAMNVLGGVKNETAGQMAALINDYTGETHIGGVNMTPQQLSSVGAAGNDLQITAFP